MRLRRVFAGVKIAPATGKKSTIDTFNLNSEEVAREMAIGALRDSPANVARHRRDRSELVVTHSVGLGGGPEMYKIFREKSDGCIKVVMKP